ncbi:ATP-binding protein [Stenotrophomonas sp.]|uniref:ATP-binding protein n=1 Tax=Stenotrophomonas sp. TaxID=69392 RepID=UPI0028A9DDF3|nr:ATP-binding protein [Stenotrophomonas sp.]
MKKKTNPFKPNSPVAIGMFAGRIDELEKLENGLNQTRNDEPANFLITGERGIGKSSLLLFVGSIASGQIKGLDHEEFKFVVLSVPISDKMGLVTLIRLLETQLSRQIGKTEVARKFLLDTWEFVQRIKIMDSGVSPAERESEEEILIDNFSYSLAQTASRITDDHQSEKKHDGILVILDEADNSTPDLRIGYFIKTVTEALQRHGCNRVMFIIAGLPETSEKLKASHESSLRVLHPVRVNELKSEDRKLVINRGIEYANKINDEKTQITNDAVDQISTLSEGYPHFIQQFAYCAFDKNKDSLIDVDDVLNSAFDKGGAIDSIGSRYYESDFYDKIKSDEYRQVLSIMAKRMNSWVKKSEMRADFKGPESKLSNALQALTGRKIILKNPARDGEYRLQQRGFALWIQLFGNRRN